MCHAAASARTAAAPSHKHVLLCCNCTLLQVLLHHFSQHQTSDDHVDKDTFFKSLGAGAPVWSHNALLGGSVAAVDVCRDAVQNSPATYQGKQESLASLDLTYGQG
jgi:hypothetical protein